jgi:hypothetical protein
MSSREDLIGGAERYLRRKLTDSEIQQLMHASDSFKRGLSSIGTKNWDKDRSIISNLLHVLILGYPVTQNLKLV